MSEAEEMAEFLDLGWEVETDDAAKAASLLRSQASEIEALRAQLTTAREDRDSHQRVAIAVQTQLATARNDALEEAAKKFEAEDHHWGPAIGAALRGMKEG